MVVVQVNDSNSTLIQFLYSAPSLSKKYMLNDFPAGSNDSTGSSLDGYIREKTTSDGQDS